MTSSNKKVIFRKIEPTLRKCFQDLLCDRRLSDVTFFVGELPGQMKSVDKSQLETIPAHKLLLSARSAVFEAMFSGSWAEKKEVIITDVHPLAFKTMLRYIYTDEIVLENEHLIHILYSAKKYQLDTLAYSAEIQICDILNENNFFDLIESVIKFEIKEANKAITKTIQYHTDWLISCPEFTELHRSTLAMILEQPSLSVSEAKLFDACLLWAKKECKRNMINNPTPVQLRNAFGSLLFMFRVSSFTACEFEEGPGKLFTEKELLEIIFYIATKKFRSETVVTQFSSLLTRHLLIHIFIDNPYAVNRVLWHDPEFKESKLLGKRKVVREWPMKAKICFKLSKNAFLLSVNLISNLANCEFFDFTVTESESKRQLSLIRAPKVKIENSKYLIHLIVPISLEAKKEYEICFKVNRKDNNKDPYNTIGPRKSSSYDSDSDYDAHEKYAYFSNKSKATFYFDFSSLETYCSQIVIA